MFLDYSQRYETLQQLLQKLWDHASQESPGSELQSDLQVIQRAFQQILSLNLEELEPARAVRIHSYQTEINKQLRLLGTDLVFLQAARLSTTAQQRYAQVSDRIHTLLRYCEAVLDTLQAENP